MKKVRTREGTAERDYVHKKLKKYFETSKQDVQYFCNVQYYMRKTGITWKFIVTCKCSTEWMGMGGRAVENE